jgi:colanic acid/amylovoran biosynthesis glycosyltransferase
VGFRLAYLTSQYPAASHTFIRREVEALRDLGWSIDTFSTRAPNPGEADNESDRSEANKTYYILRQSFFTLAGSHVNSFFRAPWRYLRTLRLALSHRAPGGRALFLAIAHFAESIVLARELQRRGIGHLHNHFANSAATVGLLASRFLHIRWSFTLHGISETDYPAGVMLGRKIQAADFVACVSWFGRAQGLRLIAPDLWNKVRVVRCGIPFERLPPSSPVPDASERIICVGRLSPEKGQTGLLFAFAILRQTHPHASLTFVGDGPDREALKALAIKLDIDDSVEFAGRLPEIQTLTRIAASDLLVLPSFMEGLPIVLMEAMALGVPVVASSVAGIPELVEDGKTGLLFAPSNWEDLASKIERLLTDNRLYEQIVTQGTTKVRGEFDSRQSAEDMSELFHNSKVQTP